MIGVRRSRSTGGLGEIAGCWLMGQKASRGGQSGGEEKE